MGIDLHFQALEQCRKDVGKLANEVRDEVGDNHPASPSNTSDYGKLTGSAALAGLVDDLEKLIDDELRQVTEKLKGVERAMSGVQDNVRGADDASRPGGR
ncbi:MULTISPECIES: hypothetical protein [unclassified Streptosporangium]|uniref:hypothetical protein n=1 Tax=unclassified Streptosporangium TaxID=2632669 RepID=UPI002E2877EA|nr:MULTISPECIES: hypothetical protein [unclassified Streptosporangium]